MLHLTIYLTQAATYTHFLFCVDPSHNILQSYDFLHDVVVLRGKDYANGERPATS